MKNTFLLLSILSLNFGVAQINLDLKKELDNILFNDQIFLQYNTSTEKQKDSIAKLTTYSREYLDENLWAIIEKNNFQNRIKVDSIIAIHGYPGKSLVGEPTNKAAYNIIWHNDRIDKYYSPIETAGKNNELPYILVAEMIDRKLISESKKQLYGTQFTIRTITNKETGKKENLKCFAPILNPKKVNVRRKKVGFDLTIEESALNNGIVYKDYTYKELARIK